MSRTQIHIIKKNRQFDEKYYEVPNAMRGAWYIWTQIEEKYLPSVPITEENKYFFMSYGSEQYRSRLALGMLSALHPERPHPLSELWALAWAKDTEWNDRILLEMNNDKAYIAYDDLHEVAEALRNSEFANENMKGQADVIDKIHDENVNGDVFGVWINATSVNCAEDFMECKYDDDGEIIERRLHPDAYDIMEFLRKIRELGWDMQAYNDWCNTQKE